MTAVQRYNALDGQTVSREELQEIAILGDIQGQVMISQKIKEVLSQHEDPTFFINVSETAIDRVPEDIMPGLEYADTEEDFTGLEKGVSPDDIYQMITEKMLDQLKAASGNGYKKKWKKQNEEGYLLPFNFETKKMYRGINIALLTEGMSKVLKNPFFLTFNQIQKYKGKLKKGSNGFPVVYFTMLYSVSETNDKGEKVEFGTYNKKKFLSWLDKNIHRLKFSLDYYKNTYIPILKYYNVFNGADVEGIDFDLENFKSGYQDGSEMIKNNDHRVEIADLIVKHYPKPQPILKDSKDGRAFFRHGFSVDEIHMPKFENFETGLDYYRTLFHEFTHSTGIASRLDRPMGGKFGSKQYAKEELVAEFGAVFLSAHAGIIWYNQKNHAEYLKNWNNVLTHAKEDNRFFMRAASKAQEAADYILNLDKEGVPKYQHALKSKPVPEKPKKGQKEPLEKVRKEDTKPAKKQERKVVGKIERKKKGSRTFYIPTINDTRINKTNFARKSDAEKLLQGVLKKFSDQELLEKIKEFQKKKPANQKDTNQLLEEQKKAKLQAKTKTEFEKGLKKLGFEIVAYTGKNYSPQEWNRKYKLNYKDIAGVSLELDLKKDNKVSKADDLNYIGESKMTAIGLTTDDYIHYSTVQEFYEEVLGELRSLFSMSVAEAADVKKQFADTLFEPAKPTAQLGLFGGKNISTEDFKNMKVYELRKFTLDYYRNFLAGKKVAIKNSLKSVSFISRTGRKIAHGGPMYAAKAALINDLEEIIKNSTYNNWGDRKPKDHKDVLGYLNFKSKINIDGEKRHVRIAVEVWRNRETLLKNYDTGKKEEDGLLPKGSKRLPSDGGSKSSSDNKDSKKKDNGLAAPGDHQPSTAMQPQPLKELVRTPQPQPKPVNTNPNSLAARMQRNKNRKIEHYKIENPDLAKFLGDVEIKEKESVGISITAPQGAGKTRFAFQLINAFAKNYKVGHASMEEHPDSGLYETKAVEYIEPENLVNIDAPDINSMNDIQKLIENNDVIVVDSFEKLREIDKNVQVDQDFRKKYDGKLFIFIFQLTSDGKMRGGSKSQFDVDIVLETEKFEDYRENYIYANKNRYNSIPPSELKFNIYDRALIQDDYQEPEPDQQRVETPQSKPIGRLIATPVE